MTANTIHFENDSFATSGVIEYFPANKQFKYKFTAESGLVNELESHLMESFEIGGINFLLANCQIDLCGAEFLAVGKLEGLK
jgi:hypothetical protein